MFAIVDQAFDWFRIDHLDRCPFNTPGQIDFILCVIGPLGVMQIQQTDRNVVFTRIDRLLRSGDHHRVDVKVLQCWALFFTVVDNRITGYEWLLIWLLVDRQIISTD